MPASHSLFFDPWNPYTQRDANTSLLDTVTLGLLYSGDSEAIDPVLFMTGCLDAPDEIALGGTSCIETIGGYCREECMRVRRDSMHTTWLQRQSAQAKLATMIKAMLAKSDEDGDL